ncbi:unnamed protein product, partial [Prorocentrum cordatum]
LLVRLLEFPQRMSYFPFRPCPSRLLLVRGRVQVNVSLCPPQRMRQELVAFYDASLGPMLEKFQRYASCVANARKCFQAMGDRRELLLESVRAARTRLLADLEPDRDGEGAECVSEEDAAKERALHSEAGKKLAAAFWEEEEDAICQGVEALRVRAEFAAELLDECDKNVKMLQAVADKTRWAAKDARRDAAPLPRADAQDLPAEDEAEMVFEIRRLTVLNEAEGEKALLQRAQERSSLHTRQLQRHLDRGRRCEKEPRQRRAEAR